jgi:GDP/UDP-N,N'-diacetylbacillosamine 2-epimerase (hydrolysing)
VAAAAAGRGGTLMATPASPRRRILAVLESRATYGYSKNVMIRMADFPSLELTTLVTGAHLAPAFGNSVELIRRDGFPVTETVPMLPDSTAPSAWPRALGGAIAGYAEAYERIAPDIVLLSGDRVETLGACIAAAYMRLPIAHIQAGDTSGHIDDSSRHAIGKFAHIHLASCEDSANRLRRMGEQEFRIFNVGAPQLDNIAGQKYPPRVIAFDSGPLDLREPYLMVMQHPVLAEIDDVGTQMAATLAAAASTGLPVVWIYPNTDQGYQQILDVMQAGRGQERIRIVSNVDRDDFLALLANASALVGNSSAGILEAPSFRVPVVNIGNRQRGRPQASNILNCGYSEAEIAAAIQTALHEPEFRARAAAAVNPYGDGQSSERICRLLAEIPLDAQLLDKDCTY